ncbi:MAG: selenocysteine-specific translation elongation factor [Planctomycetota bacterium]|jgi:selenocysteine-specific elongation factor
MTDTNTQASQINITLGTAGHIDHGKTALIKLLTGCETDRLKQEKERGMSIELGFAPCQLGDLEVGIVDVPGHENFVKTMVAGATGIDGVIFVVAADDSIMPQTREHLDILTLLGVRHGMVALTKIDLVPEDRVQQVIDELNIFLQGTFLQDAPICPMSSITGAGFDGFYTEMKALIGGIQPRSTEGIFRQPVERMFSVKGFGTVVSGIPASGSAKVGDELTLLPPGGKSRVKAIQVYGQDADIVQSGQCAALNLPQLDYKTVERGHVLTDANYFQSAQWFACTMTMLGPETKPIKNGAKLKFHTGTSETTATVYLLESDAAVALDETFVQIRTDQPVVAGPRDRYILRGLSPVQTIAGGAIIEATGHKLKRTKEGLLADIRRRSEAIATIESFVEYCIETTDDYAAKVKDLAVRVKLQPEKVGVICDELIAQKQLIPLTGELYMHKNTFADVVKTLTQQIEAFHEANPESPGIEKAQLADGSGLSKPVFDSVLAMLLNVKQLTVNKNRVALPDHSEQFDPAQQALLDKVDGVFHQQLFDPPKVEDLPGLLRCSVQEVNATVKILTEQQTLVRVDAKMLFHAEAIEEAKNLITDHVNGEGAGQLESVKFKYLIDSTRKFALPLLDYMDKIGFTRRVGNTRYLKS